MNYQEVNKFNVICFGFMPWSNMWKRNQSMMAEISKLEFIEKVIYVNPDISLNQIIRKVGKNKKFGLSYEISKKSVHPRISVYTPWHVLPFRFQNRLIKFFENNIHSRRLTRLNGNSPYILFINCPNIIYPYPLNVLLENAALTFFDFSDDFIKLVHNPRGKELFARNINTYAQAADVVLTVNEYLKKKYAYLNPNIQVVKNATNFSNFNRKKYAVVPFLENLRKKEKPIIGYSGICNATRIDVKLLEFLLIERPDWQFVFVGSKGEELAAHVGGYGNFHNLPAVDYELLPNYLNYFRVAIVPFQINDHTKGNNLLKLHDYLAMGKPVVTTNIGGAEDFTDVVRIADTPRDFLNQIEQALTLDSKDFIQRRKQVASDNAWPNRILQLKEILIREIGFIEKKMIKAEQHV